MTDIVERLRNERVPGRELLCLEAAAEIERQQEQLRLCQIDNNQAETEIERLNAEIEQLQAQVIRDDEHYKAAMGMSEKHRRLWVEASQQNKDQEAVIERLRAIGNLDPSEMQAEIDRLRTRLYNEAKTSREYCLKVNEQAAEIKQLRAEIEQLQSKMDWLGYKDPCVC
jgi:outer membrane murein-binding lipoprotein Lpp